MMDDKQLAYRIASILLDYPEELPKINDISIEIAKLKNTEIKERLLYVTNYLATKDNADLCREYVETFDFAKDSTLYLTFPKLGDKQERGDSLIEIKDYFAKAELDLNSNELPDYLPLLLEFASLAPNELAELILHKYIDSIELLHSQLVKEDSIYQHVVKSCLILLDYQKQLELKGGVS